MNSEAFKENTEISLKYKLMEILAEELSSLNLKGLPRDKNGFFKAIFQNEGEEIMKITEEEEICPIDNAADEILHKSNKVETVANNENTCNTPSKSVKEVLEKILKETCIQNEMICIVKDEVLNSPNKISPGKTPQVYDYQHKDTEYLEAESTQNIQEANDHSYEEVECFHDGEDFMSPVENTAKQVTQHRNEPIKPDSTFIPPSDSTAGKIKHQCEFLFQDYNLFKNSYLISNIRRNKEGYVYLSLLASFRKVKALTRDCRDIAYSLEKSQILELSHDRKCARRREPLPRLEDTRFGKTIVIFNLPHQNSTPEYLKELFSKFGIVIYTGVFDARDREIDAYQSRCLFYHYQIASKIYGVVEFEDFDQVVSSLRDDGNHLPKENEMIVVPLMPPVFRKQRRNLRFLRDYYPSARRSYGKFRQRNEGRYNNEAPALNGGMRNGNMITDGYYHQRGYYRRPYKGRKPFIPFGGKNYSEGHVADEYEESKRKNWQENRQLKTSNTDRFHGNVHRKKTGNGYYEASVHV